VAKVPALEGKTWNHPVLVRDGERSSPRGSEDAASCDGWVGMAEIHPSILELFCGIGGLAAALAPLAGVVAAIDQNRDALAVYQRNFPHPATPLAIESIDERRWQGWQDAMWWLSPPCTPYTTRGLRRDVDDPRARSLLAVLDRIATWRPPAVVLENVPGFAGSRAHQRLRDVLDRTGYTVRETMLCPTELGRPNRRRRFYLVASHHGLRAAPTRAASPRRLADLLDPDPSPELWCAPALADRYARGLHIVDAADPRACTSCFTSAYGRSPVRSGSYLLTPDGLRRFSPREILRLLDFPDSFTLPADLPAARAWPLVGNSVSVAAVRAVLAMLPGWSSGA
jgi:DNA (cytosine-5)-methyltransferase 1